MTSPETATTTALQALEIMLRPGVGQATATAAHAVLLSWMQSLDIEQLYPNEQP